MNHLIKCLAVSSLGLLACSSSDANPSDDTAKTQPQGGSDAAGAGGSDAAGSAGFGAA